MYRAVLLLILGQLCFSGIINMSNGHNLNVNPTTISIQSSITLGSHVWNRLRSSGGYNLFPETYQLSTNSGCKIICAPYSWPVLSGGLLYCQRDLNRFPGANTNQQPYRPLCIPDIIDDGTTTCNQATYNIYSVSSQGSC